MQRVLLQKDNGKGDSELQAHNQIDIKGEQVQW